jgi:DNA invertase Pin-like site-specific DNA recombinase
MYLTEQHQGDTYIMKNKIFGYIRVSSKDQNIDRQLDEMIELGINERDIFIEKESGKNFNRPNTKR